jgi:hypothetical protein
VKAKRSPKRKAEAQELPEELPRGRILERPDGFYWESKSGLYGPFATRGEAEADMLSGGAPEVPDPDLQVPDPDLLQETESELGINEWIDPDTGGPAEDSVPRIEDH